MGLKKKQTVIEVDDVPRVFDPACIHRLACLGMLPAKADVARFAVGIHEAALNYAEDSRRSTPRTVRDEIAALYKAAKSGQHERLAMMLSHLSPQAQVYLAKRRALPGPSLAKLRFPTVEEFSNLVEELRDPSRRDQACELIRHLCSRGGRYVEGRQRSPGKRSRTWQPELFAPIPPEHPPKRTAELWFVMNLQLTWLEAVGRPPTATVNPSRSDRPFANFVRECLRLVGAKHADAVGLINELHRRKYHKRKRLADLRRRKRREAQETKEAV